jgi:hypothetical protein
MPAPPALPPTVPFCVCWIEIVPLRRSILVTIPVMSSAKALDPSMLRTAAPARINLVVPIEASRHFEIHIDKTS